MKPVNIEKTDWLSFFFELHPSKHSLCPLCKAPLIYINEEVELKGKPYLKASCDCIQCSSANATINFAFYTSVSRENVRGNHDKLQNISNVKFLSISN